MGWRGGRVQISGGEGQDRITDDDNGTGMVVSVGSDSISNDGDSSELAKSSTWGTCNSGCGMVKQTR